MKVFRNSTVLLVTYYLVCWNLYPASVGVQTMFKIAEWCKKPTGFYQCLSNSCGVSCAGNVKGCFSIHKSGQTQWQPFPLLPIIITAGTQCTSWCFGYRLVILGCSSYQSGRKLHLNFVAKILFSPNGFFLVCVFFCVCLVAAQGRNSLSFLGLDRPSVRPFALCFLRARISAFFHVRIARILW